MRKITIALIGASVLAVGLLGCSHKTGAETEHHMMALIPIKNSSVSYDEVNIKSYSTSGNIIHVISEEGIEYIGNNIVIEKWSD